MNLDVEYTQKQEILRNENIEAKKYKKTAQRQITKKT